MLNIDRVWARQGHLFPGKRLSQMRLQVITSSYSIAGTAASANNPVAFGQGALIVGVLAAAQVSGQAATQTNRPGLDMFSVSVSYQADNRQIVGTDQVVGSALFGPYGDQYPAMELPMPINSALLYNFTGLTSSNITITLAHHCIVPGAIG